jgi:hypothetical protein
LKNVLGRKNFDFIVIKAVFLKRKCNLTPGRRIVTFTPNEIKRRGWESKIGQRSVTYLNCP